MFKYVAGAKSRSDRTARALVIGVGKSLEQTSRDGVVRDGMLEVERDGGTLRLGGKREGQLSRGLWLGGSNGTRSSRITFDGRSVGNKRRR